MSVEGFNRQHRRSRRQSNGDLIAIRFDPEKVNIKDVEAFMEGISKLPERHRGTVFTIEPEGLFFRRV